MERIVCTAPKLIHVERGSGRSRVGKTVHLVSKGDVVFVPAGEVHGGTPDDDHGIDLQVLVLPATVAEDLNDIHAHVISAGDTPQKFRQVHLLARAGAETLELEQHLVALSHGITLKPVRKKASVGRTRLRRACEIISDRCFESISLSEIAAAVSLSRSEVCRTFAREFGMTPYAYKLAIKADRARAQISKGTELGEMSLEAGYSDQAHFSKQFRRTFGLNPRDYSRGFAGN